MPISYILNQFGNKLGLNPANSIERATMLRFVNEAARELYPQCDLEGSLWEQVFKINGNQEIAFPAYIGTLRAVREFQSNLPWHINKMRPRYNQFNWKDMWRNYRLKNQQALMCTVTNESFGVLTVPAVESPSVIITLTGPTATASCVTEQVVMNATTKQSVNAFTDYIFIGKDRVNQYDVLLSDIDGKALSILPNNQLKAEYQIVDVSSAPWLAQNTSRLDNYVEILYKKALMQLVNDGDEYPCFNCDDILVNKSLQLWFEEQEKPDLALGYDAKATRTLTRLQAQQNKETEDEIALVNNPHDTLLPRIGIGNRRRYGFYRLNRL